MFVMFCLLLYCLYSVLFFFFKQKTAYEMRISDWSSDVCSSDLDSGFVKAGNTASTNPESRIPNPGFIESTVGSSGRRRAGAGNTSDFPLAILPRTGAAGSAWAADARPADAPNVSLPLTPSSQSTYSFPEKQRARKELRKRGPTLEIPFLPPRSE